MKFFSKSLSIFCDIVFDIFKYSLLSPPLKPPAKYCNFSCGYMQAVEIGFVSGVPLPPKNPGCCETTLSDKISIVNNNQIYFSQSGVFDIQFSAQLASTGADVAYIWLAKNGTNITNSNTAVKLKNTEPLVAAWNFVESFTTGDTAEIRWGATDINTTLDYDATPPIGPSVPSVLLTVIQVN